MINLITPVNTLGYGYTGYNVTKSLSKTVDVALFPIGDKIDNSLVSPEIQQSLKNAVFFDPNGDCVRIWHQHDMAQFVGRGKHVGFPIFELDKFTDIEKHHLNSCDELFLPSKWAVEMCNNNGITPKSTVVPLGVDRSVFYPTKVNPGRTVFLNCGKWEVRKGHDVLIKAFKKAFNDKDDVLLLMCNSNPFLSKEQTDNWEKLYKHPKIRLLPRLQTSQEVATMMNRADCGVFPSRAEGWNLEALEMLSCGKQLIITNYSAHKEFCSSSNSMLVDINGTEPAKDGIWFHGQGNWASIGERQIEQLASYMREVHLLKQGGRLELNDEGIATAKKFTWDNTAAKIIGGLHVESIGES